MNWYQNIGLVSLSMGGHISFCLCVTLFHLCGHISFNPCICYNILRPCENFDFLPCIWYNIVFILSNENRFVPWEALWPRGGYFYEVIFNTTRKKITHNQQPTNWWNIMVNFIGHVNWIELKIFMPLYNYIILSPTWFHLTPWSVCLLDTTVKLLIWIR